MGSLYRNQTRGSVLRLLNMRLLALLLFTVGIFYYVYTVQLTTAAATQSIYRLVSDLSAKSTLNSTLGFQKLLVLNLPSRTDRRDAMALSAAISNLKLEFVDGVLGTAVPDKALPPGDNRLIKEGIRGSWRGHMNVLRKVVEENVTSALIFEDDMDFDIRLFSQLESFALASQVLVEDADMPITQYNPVKATNTETEDVAPKNMSRHPMPEHLYTIPLQSALQHRSSIHHDRRPNNISPYGNPSKWDIIWLGHCGVGFPRPATNRPWMQAPLSSLKIRDALLSISNDSTVPALRHLKAHPFAGPDPFAHTHPPHTRVYHRASGGAFCSVAYGVSQRGARRLLNQFGLKEWNAIFDIEMGLWCSRSDNEDEDEKMERSARLGSLDGKKHEIGSIGQEVEKTDPRDKERKRRQHGERVCITSQPPIFGQHRGGESDIGGFAGGLSKTEETKYVRLSVRKNLERLVRGEGVEELEDQWPD